MTYATTTPTNTVWAERGIQPTRTDTSSASTSGYMLSDEPRTLPFELAFAGGERIAVNLTGSGYEPTSFWRVLDAFSRLSQLRSGWDSYGAQPLDPRAVRRCITLLSSLLRDEAPDPAVVPTRDGGIQIEWHHRGIDLEVNVPPVGQISYLFADAETDEEHEWEGSGDRQRINDAFTRMLQRS